MKLTTLLGLAISLLAVHAQTAQKKTVVQEIVEASVAKIQILYDSGIEQVKALVSKLFDSINGAIESVNSSLEKFKQTIKDIAAKGEKYQKCAEKMKPNFKKLEEKTNAGIVACLQVAYDKKEAMLEVLKQEDEAVQNKLGQSIAICFKNYPFTALLCATKESTLMYSQATISLPTKVLAAKSKFATISGDAVKCVKETKVKLESDAVNIQKQIEACANKA